MRICDMFYSPSIPVFMLILVNLKHLVMYSWYSPSRPPVRMRAGSSALCSSEMIFQLFSMHCVWMAAVHMCRACRCERWVCDRKKWRVTGETHTHLFVRDRGYSVSVACDTQCSLCSSQATVLGTCARGQNSLCVSCLLLNRDWQQSFFVCMNVSVCVTSLFLCVCVSSWQIDRNTLARCMKGM